MKFLLVQRLFNNNIFVQLELFRIQEITMLPNKIKIKLKINSTHGLKQSSKQDDQSLISI